MAKQNKKAAFAQVPGEEGKTHIVALNRAARRAMIKQYGRTNKPLLKPFHEQRKRPA